MDDLSENQTVFRFGRFELDARTGGLTADGAPVPLGSRASEILSMLVRNAGELVTKQALIEGVWGRLAVSDNALQVHVSTLRRVLAGLEPGPHIQTDQTRGYRFTAPIQRLAPRSPGRRLDAGVRDGGAPRPATRLIGREAELEAIVELARENRLVTLAGPGGVGKTRLALAACEALSADFPAAPVFVDLSALAEPRFLLHTVAAGFDVPIGPNDGALALCEAMRKRTALLLLDNCDHLVEAAAGLAGELLAHAPGLRIVATSRKPLGCDRELVHRVPPLPVEQAGPAAPFSPALELLVERARAIDSRFELSRTDADVATELCRRLDGLPLAIELVAGWLPSLGVVEAAARLPVLTRSTSPAAHRPPRQHSIAAAIAWSHGRLGAAEREVLGAAASFASWFDLEAAALVAASAAMPEAAVTEHVVRLVSASFLQVDAGAGRARYRLLETTRAFVRAAWSRTDADAPLRRRHAAYVRDRLAALYATWDRQATPSLRSAYEDLVGDVRAALDAALRHEIETAEEIAGWSWPLWSILGLAEEGHTWIERVLEKHVPADPGQAGRLWLGRAFLWGARSWDVNDDYGRAAKAFRSAGDAPGLALSLAKKAVRLGNYPHRAAEVEALRREAQALAPDDSIRLRAILSLVQAKIHACKGDMIQARTAIDTSCRLYRSCKEEREELNTLTTFSDMVWNFGDLDVAVALTRQAAERSGAPRFRAVHATILINLVGMLTEAGDLDGARPLVTPAVSAAVAERLSTYLFDHLALLHAKAGLLEDAARLLGHADSSKAAAEPRQPNELRAVDAARTLLTAALPRSRLTDLLAQGSRMSERQACDLAAFFVTRPSAADRTGDIPEPCLLGAR